MVAAGRVVDHGQAAGAIGSGDPLRVTLSLDIGRSAPGEQVGDAPSGGIGCGLRGRARYGPQVDQASPKASRNRRDVDTQPKSIFINRTDAS